MSNQDSNTYRYRPVLFFVLTYIFTWLFWIPAIFTPESISPVLMLAGSGFAAKLMKLDKDWKRQVFNGAAFLISAAVLYCGIYSVCVSRF